MADTELVPIPVSSEAARLLADSEVRAEMGREIERILHQRNVDALMQAVREVQAAARAAGITEAEVEAELAAYNAERRS